MFSPRLAGFVLDAFAGPGAAAASPSSTQLTPREREVLQHIARGYMYKEIALRLDISPKTVEAHVSSVLRKLQLSSRHELTRWAAERGPRALRLGVRAVLVDGAEVPGDVEVDGGRDRCGGLLACGRGGLAVPGFVDLQVNGFARGRLPYAPTPATTEPPERAGGSRRDRLPADADSAPTATLRGALGRRLRGVLP